MFNKYVGSKVLIEVLELADDLEWGAQSFAQRKPKSILLHFINNFRNKNKDLKQKLNPMPKLKELLL